MATTRKIVVRGEAYRWTMTPSDEGLRVAIRGEARRSGRLIALFGHNNLVTPWLVRQAIERGLDTGWDPNGAAHASVSFDDAQPDRPVAVAPPPPLDAIERELLARIADAGDDDDDTARLVYADWLIERGDPQGELVALACAAATRPLSDRERARTSELEALRFGWLGPVGALAQRPTWHRGLLDSCVLGRTESGVVDAALGHRGWRTVRTLVARDHFLAPHDLLRLVMQPQLLLLRRLLVAGAVVPALADAAHVFPRVTRLAIDGATRTPLPALLAALCAQLPALHELVMSPMTPVAFAALLPASTAAALVIRDGSFSLAHRAQAILAAAAPAVLRELALRPLWHSHDDPGLALVFRRGVDQQWSDLAIACPAPVNPVWQDFMLAALARLPADSLTAATLDAPHGDPLFAREIAGALAAQPRAPLR